MSQTVNNSHIIHKDTVEFVKKNLPSDELLYDVAEFFKSFSDKSRIKIICSLLKTELCVYDIANIVNMSQSAVSHQLKILRQTRLVKYRKDGKTVYYSLDDDHVNEVIMQGLTHISHK